MRTRALFGFEAGTGAPLYVTPAHSLFSGITGDGKTTAALALRDRFDATALAFEAKATPKRGTPDFVGKGTLLPTYLKGLVDDITLLELLESIFRHGLKREFGLVVQICEEAANLTEVYQNLKDRMAATKRREGEKWDKMLTVDRTLGRLMAEIQEAKPQDSLSLRPGLNVLDLRTLSEYFQQLVVQSCAEHVRQGETGTVLIVDEAHRFVPESRPAASKPGIIALCKEGRSAENWVWLASQAITSLNKQALKQVELWVLGRQREKLEVQRALDQLPVPEDEKPAKEEIMTLSKGYFYVCQENFAKKVYALPPWLSPEAARTYAILGQTAPMPKPLNEVPWN